MKHLKYALIAAVLLAPAPLLAQNNLSIEQVQQLAREKSDGEFNKMDKNQDGKISKDEYMGYVLEEMIAKHEAAFKQIDRNGDGIISKQEYEEFMNFATSKIHDFMMQIKQNNAK